MKTVNKTLITSIVVIALCLSLIAGATFAWFTSSSSTNIAVTSGSVEIEATINEDSLQLYSLKDGIQTALEEGTTDFVTGGTATIEEGDSLVLTNVVPGDKVEFNIDITNNSSISIKYRVRAISTGDASKLAEALVTKIDNGADKWSAVLSSGEAIPSVTVSVELPKDATNECQGQQATIQFVVEAVQANASVQDIVNVSSAEDIAEAAKQDNVRITLTDDISMTEGTITFEKSGTLDLNGKTITNADENHTITVANGATLTIEENEGTIINTYSNKSALYVAKGGTAIINGGTLTRNNQAGDNHYTIENCGTMIINGGTITHEQQATSSGTLTLVANKDGGEMIINGGTFGEMNVAIKNESTTGEGLVINGGTFNAVTVSSSAIGQSVQNHGKATIYDGVFNGSILNYAQAGYTGNLTIEGGTFNERISSEMNTNADATPVMTINGGTFNYSTIFQIPTTGPVVEIYGGTFMKQLCSNPTSIKGTIEIHGGLYSVLPFAGFMADGMVMDPDIDENGLAKVKEGSVTSIFTTGTSTGVPSAGFASIGEAIAYAKNKGQKTFAVALLEDRTESIVVPGGYTFYLILAGHTLTNVEGQDTVTFEPSAKMTLNPTTVPPAFYDLSKTQRKLANSGTVKNTTSGKAAFYIGEGASLNTRVYNIEAQGYAFENHGTLTLINGVNILSGNILTAENAKTTFSSGTYSVDIITEQGGTTTFNGGTVDGKVITKANGTTNITKGTFNGAITNEGKTVITGGTFATEPLADWIAEGYESKENDDGTYTVQKIA